MEEIFERRRIWPERGGGDMWNRSDGGKKKILRGQTGRHRRFAKRGVTGCEFEGGWPGKKDRRGQEDGKTDTRRRSEGNGTGARES